MGKMQKKAEKKKSVSKYANAEYEPQNAKERIEHELHLLNVRKQAITSTKKAPTVHKVKKATTKRGVSVKKQKKLARALMVADKEEKKIELAQSKAEKRKLGKQLWD
ncbi:hypothetical protein V8B55DRAFT_1507941 [Mucor lusitanicus]|uniref:Uncharacterized protein n=1 Tax=Mucor lusitanicus CBS 277.49 TaxID=747725 RepID=A0A162R590_MUCCL|nr:hypothetical protein MUCCIDRAFT_105416 [Mucor lusitanicus CBS 277.49]